MKTSAVFTILLCLLFISNPADTMAAPPQALPASAAPLILQQTVPDTLQRRCYDIREEIDCPKPGSPFYGQDGSYAVNVPEYELDEINGAEILVDHTTGLTWLRRPAQEQMTWDEAIDYADGLEAAGQDDWRLPLKRELQSILSFGHSVSPLEPPVDNGEPDRPTSPDRPCAWTLTNLKFPSLHAKAICLDDNHGTLSNKYEKKYVYLVRGPSPGQVETGRFKAAGDGTVKDLSTGLTWQQGESLPLNWQKALAHCENLELGEFDDWRLPTVKELSSLVDENRINPALNPKYFPGARAMPYWTGTTLNNHPAFAWYVKFDNGLEYPGGYKGRKYLVRAVRGGKLEHPAPALPAFLQPPEPLEAEQDELETTPQNREEEQTREFLEPYPLDPDNY